MDIQPVYEWQGCRLNGYMAKGHHDPQSFIETLIHDWAPECEVNASDVQQLYWRNVPQGDEGMISVGQDKPGRGAYAVTWLPID